MESSIASDMETNVSHTTNEEITKSGRKKKVFKVKVLLDQKIERFQN